MKLFCSGLVERIVGRVILWNGNVLGGDRIFTLHIDPYNYLLESLKVGFHVVSNIGQRGYKDKNNLPIFFNSSVEY
jgi:hypothetical protein